MQLCRTHASAPCCTGRAMGSATCPIVGHAPQAQRVFAPLQHVACQLTAVPRRAIRAQAKSSQQAPPPAKDTEYEFAFEDLGNCRHRVTVTVPGSVCQTTFNKTVEHMRKGVVNNGNVPGFRADKVPLSMIVQQVGGQKNFKSAIVEAIFEGAQNEMVERLGPDVVPNSENITTDMRDVLAAFDPAKAFSYSMEYEVVPPVKWSSSYRDIIVTLQETGDFTTDEVAAAALVREHLKSKGHQNVAIDRGLQPGDVCIIDMDIREPGSKSPLPGLMQERLNLDTEVDPLGLIAGMAGMTVNETRTFAITLPADHPVEEWQGMVCSATIKLRELFTWNLPKFDDAFVAKHFSQYDSAVAMTQAYIIETTARRMEERDMQLQLGVREGVVGCLDMASVPPSLVEQYGAREYKARLLMLVMERQATLEEVEKQATEAMIDEFIVAKKEDLEALVRFSLAIDDIAAAEGLKAEAKDIDAVYLMKRKQFEEEKIEFDADNLRNEVTETIKEAKVVEWLKDNVKTTTLPYVPNAGPAKQAYPQPSKM